MFVCVLQCIPAISITSGIPTSIIPLSFVLFFDGIVTAREDYKRHREDAIANARITQVFNKGVGFTPTAWRDVCVGDVLKVQGASVALLWCRPWTGCNPSHTSRLRPWNENLLSVRTLEFVRLVLFHL